MCESGTAFFSYFSYFNAVNVFSTQQHMSAVAAQTGGGNYVGIVPGRVLVDLIMGLWGGFFCLLVVDLVSRFAGLPIPGNVVSAISNSFSHLSNQKVA